MKKTPLLLICIILMPLLVLAWFSARVEEQQQQLVNHQLEALVESQLAKIDQSFQGHFRRLEGALNQEVARQYAEKDSEYSLPSIRNLTKSSPYIDQVFILNADRERIYPGSGNLSRSERAFINGYKELLDNRELFHVRNEVSDTAEPSERYSIPAESSVLAEARQASKTISAQLRSAPAAPEINISTQKPVQSAPYISSVDLAQEPASEAFADAENDQIVVSNIESSPSGWIAWYRGAELEQLYWKETPSGEVIGFSLNNARLMSDLINMLPDEAESRSIDQLKNAAIRMLNSQREIVYEWGQLSQIAKNAEPLQTLSLSHPLASWHLEYYSPALQSPSNSWLETYSAVLLTFLGLSLLAWMLYREQTRAARLAEQRVNFVNQVSHELKTPLTNVRMYAEMLDNQVDESEVKQKRYLDVINNESQRLSRLIENVLSFSRIGRSNNQICRQQDRICHTIEKVIGNFEPAFKQKAMSIQFDNRCESTAYFDPNAVEQILNNLLSNCEKYAADSGQVQVSCWEDGKHFCFIRVEDDGPGIDKNAAAKIFTPFYRASNKLTDGVSGTGIGLSIARELARAHNGDLVLESTQRGASFLVSLSIKENELEGKE